MLARSLTPSRRRGATLLETLIGLAILFLVFIAAAATLLGVFSDVQGAPANVRVSGAITPAESSIEVGETAELVLTLQRPNDQGPGDSLLPVPDVTVFFKVVPADSLTIVSLNGESVNADDDRANTDANGRIKIVVRADALAPGTGGALTSLLPGEEAELARAMFEIFEDS